MIGNRYLSAIIAVLCVSCPYVQSQDTDSRVSPLYFGPNALPVPEMLDGKVYERLHTEIAFDLHMGYHGDLTETVFVKLNIPLFSSRVNLSLWMPVVEFYIKHCGIIGMAGSSGAEPQGDCDWKTLHLNGYTAAEADTDKTGYCRQGRNCDGIGGHREIREILLGE